MSGPPRAIAGAATIFIGLLSACGSGTGPWVDYLHTSGILRTDLPGYDQSRYEMTRTGYEMCRLLRDDDLNVDQVVIAYGEHDPALVRSLAVGADKHLCDHVNYHDELEPWDES